MTSAEDVAAATIGRLLGAPEQRVAAARSVKNAVVGNPTNKHLYMRLGAVPALVAAAAVVEHDPALAEQAVAALGSLAALLPPHALGQVSDVLLAALFSPDPRPVNAAARALKMLFTAERTDFSCLAQKVAASSGVAERLVMLLSGPDEGIAEICAVIVAKSSVGYEQAQVYAQGGVIPALVMLLSRTNHERCVEACLSAMSALSFQDRTIGKTLAGIHNVVTLVLPFTRSPTHSLRLAACRLLTVFHTAAQLPSGLDGAITTALVGLLNTEDIRSQIATAHTLAELTLASERLQKAATEADAIERLRDVIKTPPDTDTASSPDMDYQMSICAQPASRKPEEKPALHAAALTALAALCSDFDDARERVVSEQMLPFVIDSLSSIHSEVVLASVKCIRSLGKSITVLRRDIARASIGEVLLSLLTSGNREVRGAVSATLCNFVLEFSPIRRLFVEKGGINTLTKLLGCEDTEVRKNALWALKNLLFKSDSAAKRSVITELGYDRLHALCLDRDAAIRHLAMAVVRNLASSGSADARSRQLDLLLSSAGDRLIALLTQALSADAGNSDVAEQALYVVCNIASGTEKHKAMLIESEIPRLVLHWTSHANEKARVAAVWCAINLSWRDQSMTALQSTPIGRRSQRSSERSHSRGRREVLGRRHYALSASRVEQIEHVSPDSAPNRSRGLLVGNPIELSDSSPQTSTSGTTTGALGVDASCEREAGHRSPEAGGEERRSGYEWRIARLRELGFVGRLRSLSNEDPHIEVQGRARAALELFDGGDGPRLDYDPSSLLDCNSILIGRQSPRSPPILLRVAESDSSSAGSST